MVSADPRDPIYGQPYTGTADVQTVTVTGAPTGGTFTLTFNGQTTAGIAYNAAASAVQSALVALSTIGANNVTVTGAGPYVVTFAGALAPGYQNLMTASGAGLTGGTTPGVTVTHTTLGSPMLQAPRQDGSSQTVLDMNRKVQRLITIGVNDNHYTSDGDLYHE
ncbi:MAG TPA: hypothetical protein VFH56_02825 [Acidimicrobiales bacterium]|nr:hypothetical protein [Acidimicrobiales bacterium]